MDHFKVFIKFVTSLCSGFWPVRHVGALSSPTRDWTCTPCVERHGLTPGPPWSPLDPLDLFKADIVSQCHLLSQKRAWGRGSMCSASFLESVLRRTSVYKLQGFNAGDPLHTSLTLTSLNTLQISNCQFNTAAWMSGGNCKYEQSKIYPIHCYLNPLLIPTAAQSWPLEVSPTTYCHHHLPWSSGSKLRSHSWFLCSILSLWCPAWFPFRICSESAHCPFPQGHCLACGHHILSRLWSQPLRGSLGFLSWIPTLSSTWQWEGSFQNASIRTLPQLATHGRAQPREPPEPDAVPLATLLPLPSGPPAHQAFSPFWTQQAPGCSSPTCFVPSFAWTAPPALDSLHVTSLFLPFTSPLDCYFST